jgi:glycosyltransferase involved in cell wall biosynthesis
MQELSEVLRADRVNLSFRFGPRYLAPLRYLVLFIRTEILLLTRRPDSVYAQNPAIFCPLSCLLYCAVFKKKLIIDHHAVWSIKTLAGGLLGKSIGRLEKFASRSAFANTTPHPLWARELDRMGARGILTIYDFVKKPTGKRSESMRRKYSNGEEFIALAPHGGHPLERVENEIEAARQLTSFMLLLSGPRGKLEPRLGGQRFPPNARYVGFLEPGEYNELEASVDFGLSITDEPFTVSHSLLEFAANRIPIVSSRQGAVVDLFGDSISYVDSSDPSRIVSAMKELITNPALIKEFERRLDEKQKLFASSRQEAEKQLVSLLS